MLPLMLFSMLIISFLIYDFSISVPFFHSEGTQFQLLASVLLLCITSSHLPLNFLFFPLVKNLIFRLFDVNVFRCILYVSKLQFCFMFRIMKMHVLVQGNPYVLAMSKYTLFIVQWTFSLEMEKKHIANPVFESLDLIASRKVDKTCFMWLMVFGPDYNSRANIFFFLSQSYLGSARQEQLALSKINEISSKR